jgi:hypothetical protein
MATYQFHCEECGHVTDQYFRYEERPTHVPCEICQQAAEYRIGAPLVMNASLPDGTKRKGFADLKEAAKLHVEALDKPPADRVGYYNEMRKLQSIKK